MKMRLLSRRLAFALSSGSTTGYTQVNTLDAFVPHSPEGLSWYCFDPWCPDGRAGG